jgi:hypothetical protein
MKIKHFIILLTAIVMIAVFCTTAAYALTESEAKNAISTWGCQ